MKDTKIYYPKPGLEEQWKLSMERCVQKGYMSKAELKLCLEAGGIPKSLLELVRKRMDIYMYRDN